METVVFRVRGPRVLSARRHRRHAGRRRLGLPGTLPQPAGLARHPRRVHRRGARRHDRHLSLGGRRGHPGPRLRAAAWPRWRRSTRSAPRCAGTIPSSCSCWPASSSARCSAPASRCSSTWPIPTTSSRPSRSGSWGASRPSRWWICAPRRATRIAVTCCRRTDPDHAFLCAHRVALLHQGRLARLGPPDEVITRESLREVYGVEVTVMEVARAEGRVARVCVPALGATGRGARPGRPS